MGVLTCHKCKKFKMSVMIPFNKNTMDEFDKHTSSCSENPYQTPAQDNVTLGYN